MARERSGIAGPAPGSRLAWRLFSNYAFQLVNLGVRLFEQLLMIPLCISAWGTELYKDWLLLYSIVVIIFWCSFGLDQYFGVKFLNLVTLKDEKGLRRQIHLGLFAALIVTLIIAAILYGTLASIDISRALTLSKMDRRTAMFCLVVMTLPVFLWIFAEVLRSLYRAYGDFSRGECLFAVFNSTQIITVIVLLIAHRPPTTVAVAYLIIDIIYALGTIADVRRRYPAMSFGFAIPTWRELCEIVPQSLLYFTNPLSVALTQNATMLLFGVLNVAAVATVKYNVLRVFTGLTRQIGAQSFAVGSGIEMARQHAQNDLDACRRLYASTGRIGSCIVGLLAGLSVPVSTPFVTAWTHGAVPHDTPLVLCFLAAVFLAAPGQASMSLLRYSHHPRPIAIASLAYSCGGLLLCFALVPAIGVIGAAMAFMITESLAIGIYQPIMVGSLFGFSAVRHILASYAAGLCVFVPSFAIAAALFAAPGTGLVGIVLRIALWAVFATPIAAMLAMTSTQRLWLLALARRRLAGFRRGLAEPTR